jgi:hypothetical protein
MPRPRKFTEAVRRERARERLRRLHPEWEPPTVASPVYDAQADTERNRRAQQARATFDEQTENENRRVLAIARKLIDTIATDPSKKGEFAAELAGLFTQVRWHWNHGRDRIPDPMLPRLGGAQPTHGEMRTTLDEGLRHATALRDWYRSLPPALLRSITVPMEPEPSPSDDPPIGVVVERLAEILGRVAEQYEPKPGRQSGERYAAQRAAYWLVWFLDRRLPNLAEAQRHSFIFDCLRELGIPCPDLRYDPGDFKTWFAEMAASAGADPG